MTTLAAFARATLAALAVSTVVVVGSAPSALAEIVLHRGNGSEPQTLDQAHTSIDVEANILKDLYEGLTVYDAGGKIIPGVADAWAVSEDGLTYTFQIRDAAKWSNGDPVTADDFVFSFRRIEDPKEAAGYANILYPIKNAEAINTAKEGAAVALDTLGVKALDAKTLEPGWKDFAFRVDLHQSLLPTLEDEALWAMARGYAASGPVPNFLPHLHLATLLAVQPERVTVVH